MPTAKETRLFLEERRRRVRIWKRTGPVAALLMLALTLWLVSRHPLLINPMAVARGIADGTLSESTTLLMAALLPVMTGACLVLVFVLLLWAQVAFSHERRLMDIVETLSAQAEGDDSA